MKNNIIDIDVIEKEFGIELHQLKYCIINDEKELDNYHNSLADGMNIYSRAHGGSTNYIKSMSKKIEKKNYQEIAELFCKMIIEGDYEYSGIYLWTLDDELVYIGQTKNLNDRFKNGYGNISPRNVFYGGQSTNCKMNYVMNHYKERIEIYYMKCNDGDESKKWENKLLAYVRKINDESNDKGDDPVCRLYNHRGNKKEYRRDIP